MPAVAEATKLILCAGPSDYGPEFKTHDGMPEFGTDYVATLPPLPAEIMERQWDEIYLIHGIEHFYLWDAMILLSNMHEALAPGGLLVLEQPNVRTCAEVFLGLKKPMTRIEEHSGIGGIYGGPTPFLAHKYGWTPESLTEACISVGFSPEKVKSGNGIAHPCAYGRDFRIEATK